MRPVRYATFGCHHNREMLLPVTARKDRNDQTIKLSVLFSDAEKRGGIRPGQRSGVSVGLSPVPIWPEDGFIPPELGDRYVFPDPEAGQLVLSYPENLGRTDFERNPGARPLTRIERRAGRAAHPALRHSGADILAMTRSPRPRIGRASRTRSPTTRFNGLARDRLSCAGTQTSLHALGSRRFQRSIRERCARDSQSAVRCRQVSRRPTLSAGLLRHWMPTFLLSCGSRLNRCCGHTADSHLR